VNQVLLNRLARAVRAGRTFTADDITDGKYVAGGIGNVMRWADSRGLIEHTGDMVTRRPGGSIHIWQSTPKGRVWADARLAQRGDL